MNKIEKMVKELCPHGIEFRSIGSLIKRYNKKAKNITDIKVYSVSKNEGLIPADEYREHIIHSQDTSNYTIMYKGMFAYNPARLNIGSIAYLKDNQALVSPMYVVFEIDTTKLMQQFLLYLLQSSVVLNKIISLTESGARFRFDFNRWNSILIPVPPLEIQAEIVSILDTCVELSTNLQAELQARKKQYEYYRDKLLSFDNILKRVGVVKKLGEVANIIRGQGLSKSEFVEKGIPCIHYGQIYTYYKLNADRTISFTDNEIASKLQKVYYNDIIMAVTSENIDDVGKSVVWLGNEKIVTGGHTAIIKTKQNGKYINYWFSSEHFRKQKIKIAHGTKVIEITPNKLNNILISIPPLEVQEEIVNILDKFERMCNSLTEGLPSEIAARKKQYEYYRDKLLSF